MNRIEITMRAARDVLVRTARSSGPEPERRPPWATRPLIARRRRAPGRPGGPVALIALEEVLMSETTAAARHAAEDAARDEARYQQLLAVLWRHGARYLPDLVTLLRLPESTVSALLMRGLAEEMVGSFLMPGGAIAYSLRKVPQGVLQLEMEGP